MPNRHMPHRRHQLRNRFDRKAADLSIDIEGSRFESAAYRLEAFLSSKPLDLLRASSAEM